MSGFATGLNAGVNAASKWVSLYNAAADARARKEIMNAKPEDTFQFSDAQGLRVNELANQGANVQWDPVLGGYTATQGAPADGMGPAASQEFIAPAQRGTSFLGQQYDRRLNPDELTHARRSALADHYGIRDPEAGMRMQASADALYQQDQVRTQARGLKAAEDHATEFLKGANTKDVVDAMSAVINPMAPDGSGAYGMLAFDEKSGGATLIYDLGGKTITANLTPAEVRSYAHKALVAGKGDMSRGLTSLIGSLNEARTMDVAGRDKQMSWDNTRSQIIDREEERALRDRQLRQTGRYQDGMLAHHGEELDFRREDAQRRAETDRMGRVQFMQGEDGSTVMAVPVVRDGRVTMEVMDMPKGLRLPSRGGGGMRALDDGTTYTDDTGNLRTYDASSGGFMAPNGIRRDAEQGVLNKSGINPGQFEAAVNQGKIKMTPDRTGFILPDRKVYDPRNAADAAAIKKFLNSDASLQVSEREREAALKSMPKQEDMMSTWEKYKANHMARPMEAPNSYRDPVWDRVERDVARMTGVPERVLRSVRTLGERSNGNQVSPKGARGVYQFTPDSQQLFLKRYGVDAYSADPREQSMAAALHLRESFQRTGNWSDAAAGYNGGPRAEKTSANRAPETVAYVERVNKGLNVPQ